MNWKTTLVVLLIGGVVICVSFLRRIETVDAQTAEVARRTIEDAPQFSILEKPELPLVVPVSQSMVQFDNSTPDAAQNSLLAAIRGSDVDSIIRLIALDADSQAALQILIDRLTEPQKSQFSTPEKVMAWIYAAGQHMETIEVISETTLSTGDIARLIRFKFRDDPRVREEGIVFHHGENGWTELVSPSLVKRVIRNLQSLSRPR